jgi:hypothetical protein
MVSKNSMTRIEQNDLSITIIHYINEEVMNNISRDYEDLKITFGNLKPLPHSHRTKRILLFELLREAKRNS